jgi:hypothetical protein
MALSDYPGSSASGTRPGPLLDILAVPARTALAGHAEGLVQQHARRVAGVSMCKPTI